MTSKDYNLYLDIVSRLESKDLTDGDLNTLYSLSNSYPKNPTIYRTIVDVAVRLHVLTGETSYFQSAILKLEEAKELGIDETTIIELKLFLYSLGEYQEKFEILISKLEASDHPTAELKNKRARYFYQNGRYDEGQRAAQEAATLNPTAENLYLVAINQTASGDYIKARSTLEKLIQDHPQHWSSYSLLGVIELENGNLAAAKTAITSIPEDLRGWRTNKNLGVIYFLQKKYIEALKHYQQALYDNPNNATIKSHIAETYSVLGDKEKAKKIYIDLVKLTNNRHDLKSLQYQSEALASIGRKSEAIATLHNLLKQSPDDTYVRYTAAKVYALLKEWNSANYYTEQLLQQGMGTEWFNLPPFQQLCAQHQVSEAVAAAICK